MLTLDKIYHSAFLLKNITRLTSLIEAPNLYDGANIFLKTENLQVTGSFKMRGAFCKISQLNEEERKRGVIACSAGNHAQGVALAAQRKDISAVICLPHDAPISKVMATKGYGAEVVRVNGVYDDAYQHALKLQEETGRVFIHPFDDEDVIAGQGTIGLEILDQLPDVDVIIAPIGGGGLISGIAFAAKSLNPHIKVYGVQAEGAPSMYNAIRDKEVKKLSRVSTIADGIAIKRPAELTYNICKEYVDEIVTVSDDEIACAILTLLEKYKVITEGAGAVSVAAVMFDKLKDLKGKKVACILSGGNIDVSILSRVISKGMHKSGRMSNLIVLLNDKPGQLSDICRIVASLGANILSIHHDRSDEHLAVNSCFLSMDIETRDNEHVQEVRDALAKAGYEIVHH